MVIETKDIGLPNLLSSKNRMSKYVVKYYKADLNEPADMLELSQIETRAIHSKAGDEEVVLMSTDKYTFLERYFIVIKYLERVA